MLLRLILILFVLLSAAAVIVIRQPYLAGPAIGATVLIPAIFVVQLIVGWLCLRNPEFTDDKSAKN